MRSLADYKPLSGAFRKYISKRGYGWGLAQKLAGVVPTLEDIVALTEGIITVMPRLFLATISANSPYPFSIYMIYRAESNGVIEPYFAGQIRYFEVVERLSDDQLSRLFDMGEESVERMENGAQRGAAKVMILYRRDAIVDISYFSSKFK